MPHYTANYHAIIKFSVLKIPGFGCRHVLLFRDWEKRAGSGSGRLQSIIARQFIATRQHSVSERFLPLCFHTFRLLSIGRPAPLAGSHERLGSSKRPLKTTRWFAMVYRMINHHQELRPSVGPVSFIWHDLVFGLIGFNLLLNAVYMRARQAGCWSWKRTFPGARV